MNLEDHLRHSVNDERFIPQYRRLEEWLRVTDDVTNNMY